jgi:acylglycerol lipase
MKLKLALLALLALLACFAFAIVEREEYKNKARFLYGESMGGAVVLYIHWKEPQEWNGAILIAPMCKVRLF